jgi:hypothetical protein
MYCTTHTPRHEGSAEQINTKQEVLKQIYFKGIEDDDIEITWMSTIFN